MNWYSICKYFNTCAYIMWNYAKISYFQFMLLKSEAVFSLVFCNVNKKSKGPSFWTNLNCYKTIHVAKFRWVLVEKIIGGQCIFTILLLFPLREKCGPSFKQNWIFFTKLCFVPHYSWIGLMVRKWTKFKQQSTDKF